MAIANGVVYILGSGPGHPGLLTQQGIQVLQRADVLVYDALVNAEILERLPSQCERIYMGKRGGQISVSQQAINEVLVNQCRAGKTIVRLKSGDPFIFGRCRSELDALIAAQCRVVVLPGLSSAIAGATLAGIPLTDPDFSNCFAVVSAHDPQRLDWQALARLDTLVILMGTHNLADIVDQLLQHGKAASTPVAILRWVSQPHYQEWQGTLTSITAITAGSDLSPAIIVVGQVVQLRHQWADSEVYESAITALTALESASLSNPSYSAMSHPLYGQTVLVTRAAGQSSTFSRQLQDLGATVLEVPALEIQPPSSWDALDAAIQGLDAFHWLILTSANAVNYFCDRLGILGKDARSLAGLKIAVVGEKTAQVLAQRSLKPDFIPPQFVADALIEHFPETISGQSFLFPRVEAGGRDILVQALTAQGATVTEVAAYQSGCPAQIDSQALLALRNKQVNMITFASSKTVRCFGQLLGDGVRSLVAHSLIASIGPQTSQTCESLFGRVDIEATDYTLEGLTQAIVQAVQAKQFKPSESND
jgi:uroporphyrinogen III methyltransferase / synthase